MADIVQKRFFSLGAGKVKRVLLSLSTVATNFHPSIFLVAHFITSVICGSSSARAPFFFFARPRIAMLLLSSFYVYSL
jgi:hypothetical protein